MDYSFRSSATESERKILLTTNALHLYVDGAKYSTPYEKVVGVWLSTPSGFLAGNTYACTLNIEDAKPIYISIKNYDDAGKLIEQANHYNSFIRVLHLHLCKKSKAHYFFGVKPASYAAKLIVLLAVVMTCVTSYFVFNLSGLLILPVGVALMVSAYTLLSFGIKSFPKLYDPDEIPLRLLPN
ncbi:MAG: hypothetical protein AAF149_21120 [Bacteroidota bacterium]